MLQCPVCHYSLMHKVIDDWFKCPGCKKRICLRVNQDGRVWVETESFENFEILSKNIERPFKFPPNEQQFPKIGNAQPRDAPPIEQHFKFKGKYESGKWVLTEEKPEDNQPAKSTAGGGWIFGCSTILVALAIYVFSRLVGLELNIGTYSILIIVSLGCGIIVHLIAR